MMLLKMIEISKAGKESTNEEIRIFLKSLKPRMKLALLNKCGYPDKYVEQLIAENYLNGLLEGYTPKFVVPRLVEYLNGKPCLVLKGRIKSIYSAMTSVIKRRELALDFEDDFEDEVGSTIHDPPNDECCNCCDKEEIIIGFRIEEDRIKCIDYSDLQLNFREVSIV